MIKLRPSRRLWALLLLAPAIAAYAGSGASVATTADAPATTSQPEAAPNRWRASALAEAGRKRATPIVMTTIAMSAGMAPSALSLGGADSFRPSMAIAVIGGLIASTALSLVFVPAAFTVMDDLGRVLRRLFGRFVGPAADSIADVAKSSGVKRCVSVPHGAAMPDCQWPPRTRRPLCIWISPQSKSADTDRCDVVSGAS